MLTKGFLPMAKQKTVYTCQHCGAQYPKWNGQCLGCNQWNCLVEETLSSTPRYQGYAVGEADIISMSDVALQTTLRTSSGLEELDRVLGGGLVMGSVILLGGDPGIGKSTLLLQTITHLSRELNVLYVTGEESLQQIALRAHRLGLKENKINLLAETQIEKVLASAQQEKPHIMVIDSIQTMHT